MDGNRRRKLTGLMEELGLDALLVADGCNMRYLTGFSGGTGYVYVGRERAVILTDSRYTTQAREESGGLAVLEISREAGYPKLLGQLLSEDGGRTLGFEDGVMLYRDVAELQEKLAGIVFVPLGGRLDALRRIKTPEELEKIAEAERIGDQAFAHLLGVLHPGMTEMDVVVELESHMKRNGASGLSFETIAASGPHSAMPHAAPTMRRLAAGDFLTVDFGCVYDGYCSDMTRTVVIGKASGRQREIYETVLRAQEEALRAIRPGLTGAQVDEKARSVIGQAGYGAFFGHGLGHSVGLYIHEEPRLSPSETAVLEAGMTETVEPGIYIPDFGGVRIEDLVAVTEDGCRNLTFSPKELIEIR